METSIIEIPKPKIKTRHYDPQRELEGLSQGLNPVVARVLAARPNPVNFSLSDILNPKLTHLLAPHLMADITKASERVSNAIINQECIGIETDHDCDGQTSHAVLFYNLIHRFNHAPALLRSYIGHRLTEGYGLSEPVAKRILNDEPKPSLVITADNGSSDEPRIYLLKEAGIDVIVTDHHEIPKEGYPKSAFACLNPTRSDCQYSDPYIAGCMVAWLLMAATRQKLIEKNYLPSNTPSLSDSLDFVAVGTVADCVSMARSQNNRVIVNYGLNLIAANKRPCWRALQEELKGSLSSEDLGFKIGPLLNSDGRLSTAFRSVNFLLSETDEEAKAWVETLRLQNTERKNIQKTLVADAIKIAAKQVEGKRSSICIYLANGHSGVQGIAASRIKEMFGRPTAIFAPKINSEFITGSLRGVEDFHVRQALQFVSDKYPEMLASFGGHQGAGGVTLRLQDFDEFSLAFEKAAEAQCQLNSKIHIGPIIYTDGELKSEDLNINLLNELMKLEPFGREFETPVFEITGILSEIKYVGDGTHAKIQFLVDNKKYSGIWFNMRRSLQEPVTLFPGMKAHMAVSLKDNYFRGQRNFDIQIIALTAQTV